MSSTFSRVCNIDAGRVMVVTDLHGDWALYTRFRDKFIQLKDQGQVNTLVIAGDYIHSEESSENDQSLAIVLDLIDLKNALDTALIVLLGNHEMPHIYHIPLSKGTHIYTPRFESVLGKHRQKVIDFFELLPMWVRTRAGVSICHAGAFAEVHDPAAVDQLFNFTHRALLKYAEDQLNEVSLPMLRKTISSDMSMPYEDVVKHYLAVNGREDPRFDHYVLGAIASQHPDFGLLWSALFSANELQYGKKAYSQHVKTLLAALSQGYYRQNTLVVGHIGCRGGYRVLANNQQLRLASGVHAHPVSTARALIFDAATPVPHARALIPGLLHLGEIDQ